MEQVGVTMQELKCPYCKQENFIPYPWYLYATKGSGFNNFKCKHCGEVVKGKFRVTATVEVMKVEKTTEPSSCEEI